MLIFKDEDLGLTYECTTAEELAAAVAIHQRTHHQSIEAAQTLRSDLTNVVNNINPAPTAMNLRAKPSEQAQAREIPGIKSSIQGLGANQSAEQGDEELPLPDGWLSPAQYSEPPATLTPAEEALANAYQEQDHLKLQSEVMRLRQELKERDAQPKYFGEQSKVETFESICSKFKAGMGMTLADQIKALEQARAGLAMWNMDTSGVDAMLRQHGILQQGSGAVEPLKAEIDSGVNLWALWSRFRAIMEGQGFGSNVGEDRSDPNSYLDALDRYLNKLVEFHSAAQDAQRVLDSKDQMIGQYRATLERVEGRHSLLKTDCDELRQEIIALKKGNTTLTAKLQRNKEKYERESVELCAANDLNLGEKKRLDVLLSSKMDELAKEVAIREQAVNDNITLSETNKKLREKLEFCLKAVPSIESAWEVYHAQGAKPTGIG